MKGISGSQLREAFNEGRIVSGDDKETIKFYKEIATEFNFSTVKKEKKLAFILAAHMVHSLPYFVESLMALGDVALIIPKSARYIEEVRSSLAAVYQPFIFEGDINKKQLTDNPGAVTSFLNYQFFSHSDWIDYQFIILDHGGYFASFKMMSLLQQYKSRILGVIEHTWNGEIKYQAYLDEPGRVNAIPFYSVARSGVKAYESDEVAQRIIDAVKGEIIGKAINQSLNRSVVGVVGYGNIGRSVALKLKKQLPVNQIIICDVSKEALEVARREGFTQVTENTDYLFSRAKFIITATSSRCFTQESVQKLTNEPIIICGTSQDDQFKEDAFDAYSVMEHANSSIVTMYQHKETGQKFSLAFNGCSINFVIGSTAHPILSAVFAVVSASAVQLANADKNTHSLNTINRLSVEDEVRVKDIWENSFGLLPPHSVSENAPVERRAKLGDSVAQMMKAHYQRESIMQPLFGPPLSLEKQYINVQMLSYSDKSDKDKTEAETKPVSDEVSEKEMTKEGAVKKVPVHLDELLASKNSKTKSTFILVHGRAGIGKTTLVNYVANECMQGRLWPRFRFVFVLRLRDLKAFNQDRPFTLREWVHQSLFVGEVDAEDFKDWWESELQASLSQTLFILDGYDEMPDKHPCEQALSSLLNNPRITKLVTSRPHGIHRLPANRCEIEITGFTDDNIGEYVKTYFGASQSSLPVKICESLPKYPLLWGNAHIPITLNILCGLLEAQATNAENVGQVLENVGTMSALYQYMEFALLERTYRRCVERSDEQLRHVSQENIIKIVCQHYAKERTLLAAIGLAGFRQQKLILPRVLLEKVLEQANIPVAEISQWIKRLLVLGLLKVVSKGNEIIGYEFLHLTFQEYYAGRAAMRAFIYEDDPALLKKLVPVKPDPRYQIVWWFLSGALKEDETAWLKLINFLREDVTSDLMGNYQLGLLVRCVEEAWDMAEKTGVLAEVRVKVQQYFSTFARLYRQEVLPVQTVPNRSAVLVIYPFKSTLVSMLKLSPRWLAEHSPENDLFATALIPSAIRYGERSNINFIRDTKLATPLSIAYVERLLMGSNLASRRAAFNAVKALGEKIATPRVICSLMTWLNDESENDSVTAIRALVACGASSLTEEQLEKLTQLLTEKKEIKYRGAMKLDATKRAGVTAELIRNIGERARTPKVIEYLIGLLDDTSSSVRSNAIKSIHHFSSVTRLTEKSYDDLMKFLVNGEEQNPCGAALEAALALEPRLVTPKMLEIAVNLLSHKVLKIRSNAVNFLNQYLPQDTRAQRLSVLLRNKLMTFLPNNPLGEMAEAYALSTPQALEYMWKLLGYHQENCVSEAVNVLLNVSSIVEAQERIFWHFEVLLNDPDILIQKNILDILANLQKIKSMLLFEKLVDLSFHQDVQVRRPAVLALMNVGRHLPDQRPMLLNLFMMWLSDEDIEVKNTAVTQITKLPWQEVSTEIRAELTRQLNELSLDPSERIKISLGQFLCEVSKETGIVEGLLPCYVNLLADPNEAIHEKIVAGTWVLAYATVVALKEKPEALLRLGHHPYLINIWQHMCLSLHAAPPGSLDLYSTVMLDIEKLKPFFRLLASDDVSLGRGATILSVMNRLLVMVKQESFPEVLTELIKLYGLESYRETHLGQPYWCTMIYTVMAVSDDAMQVALQAVLLDFLRQEDKYVRTATVWVTAQLRVISPVLLTAAVQAMNELMGDEYDFVSTVCADKKLELFMAQEGVDEISPGAFTRVMLLFNEEKLSYVQGLIEKCYWNQYTTPAAAYALTRYLIQSVLNKNEADKDKKELALLVLRNMALKGFLIRILAKVGHRLMEGEIIDDLVAFLASSEDSVRWVGAHLLGVLFSPENLNYSKAATVRLISGLVQALTTPHYFLISLFVSFAQHYFDQCFDLREETPDVWVLLMVASYLSDEVHFAVQWNDESHHYALHIFVGNHRSEKSLTLKEAQLLRHLAPKILSSITELDLARIPTLIESLDLPKLEEDDKLSEYRAAGPLLQRRFERTPFNFFGLGLPLGQAPGASSTLARQPFL